MTTYLLDVNVLIALSDSLHVHHEAAHAWFATVGSRAWATCPLTENGFVRVISHPRYPNRPGDASGSLAILRAMCALPSHAFWTDSVTLREKLQPSAIVTHAQVTDVYLLALATERQGKLATFDQRIRSMAVPGGATAIEDIPVTPRGEA